MQIRVRNQYLKKLIMIDKIYKNNNKFSSTDDNFSFKIINFLNNYK